VGRIAYLKGVDTLVAVGALAEHYAQGARLAGMKDERIFVCSDIEDAMRALVVLRREAPIILVKASRFMALERIVNYLIQGYEPPVPDVEGRNADERNVAGQSVETSSFDKQGKEAAE
jgi:hypothetical protein